MSSLFGGGGTPAAPKLPDPTPLPDTDGPEAQMARRKALADAAARGGRGSTIMGGGAMDGTLGGANSNTAAGDSYSNTTLGGGR